MISFASSPHLPIYRHSIAYLRGAKILLVKGYRVTALDAEWDDADEEILWRLYRLPDDHFLPWSSESGIGEMARVITLEAGQKLIHKWRSVAPRELENA